MSNTKNNEIQSQDLEDPINRRNELIEKSLQLAQEKKGISQGTDYAKERSS
jgi:hypothetical protein